MIRGSLERSNRTCEEKRPSLFFEAVWSALIAMGTDVDSGAGNFEGRLAGAPISWGVCEVPGWGRQLPPDRVFAEMASLGLRATELGPVGYLPLDAERIRERLGSHGLRLVGGFVPLVLHEQALDIAPAERMAAVLAGAGADVFVLALVQDEHWSAPTHQDEAAWQRLTRNLAAIDELVAAHGLTLALHPHVGTLVETAADVHRMLETSDVGWCLDTGHLLIGGFDPVELARRARVVHVHLKDVDAAVAARLRAGEIGLVGATQAGLFTPLGEGDARIDEVLGELEDYQGWLVLEQDTAITGQEPPVGDGPLLDVRRSVEYLHAPAPRRERVAET
jgi:inosose dehydratase